MKGKIFFSIILILTLLLYRYPTKAADNEPLITLMQQLIALLTQQVEILTKQLILQQSTYSTNNISTPLPTNAANENDSIKIISVYVEPLVSSAFLEWYTNCLTESKVYISSPGHSGVNVYDSEAGFSNHHVLNLNNLKPNTSYNYQILVSRNDRFITQTGEFRTYPLAVPDLKINLVRSDQAVFNDTGNLTNYLVIQITSASDIPYPHTQVKIHDQIYTTDNRGEIIYRLTENEISYLQTIWTSTSTECGIPLSVLTNPLEKGWDSFTLSLPSDVCNLIKNFPPPTPCPSFPHSTPCSLRGVCA